MNDTNLFYIYKSLYFVANIKSILFLFTINTFALEYKKQVLQKNKQHLKYKFDNLYSLDLPGSPLKSINTRPGLVTTDHCRSRYQTTNFDCTLTAPSSPVKEKHVYYYYYFMRSNNGKWLSSQIDIAPRCIFRLKYYTTF